MTAHRPVYADLAAFGYCDCGMCVNENHADSYVPRHSSDLPPVGMVGGSDAQSGAAPIPGLPVVGVLAVDATGGGAASSAALGRLDAANTNPGAQQ